MPRAPAPPTSRSASPALREADLRSTTESSRRCPPGTSSRPEP
jgi:hypothetical protein